MLVAERRKHTGNSYSRCVGVWGCGGGQDRQVRKGGGKRSGQDRGHLHHDAHKLPRSTQQQPLLSSSHGLVSIISNLVARRRSKPYCCPS